MATGLLIDAMRHNEQLIISNNLRFPCSICSKKCFK